MIQLPTTQQCLDYFNEYKVPANIKEHCLKVREVAVFLAKRLREKDLDINVELVDRTALLHDLFKVVVIKDPRPNKFHKRAFTDEEIEMWKKLREKYASMYESEVAYEIFKDVFPKLAVCIKNSCNIKNTNKTWEELAVHYADFRVFRSEIASNEEIYAYLKEQYPVSDDTWEKFSQLFKVEEEKLFSQLDFLPENLAVEVENVEIENGVKE